MREGNSGPEGDIDQRMDGRRKILGLWHMNVSILWNGRNTGHLTKGNLWNVLLLSGDQDPTTV